MVYGSPVVHSVSMKAFIGYGFWASEYNALFKLAQMTRPGPANTFVIRDECPGLNDGFFAMRLEGNDNTTTARYGIWDPKYWEPRPHDHNAVLSKFPFVSTHSQLIQADPGRDQWLRTAEHVRLQIGAAAIDIFNFHNAYNWFNNDYQYEKSGLVAIRNYVTGLLGVVTVNDGGNLVMGGDFNLYQDNVVATLLTPGQVDNGLDHFCAVPHLQSTGTYNTIDNLGSDHNAVWGALADKLQMLPDHDHPNNDGAGEMAKAAFKGLTGHVSH